MTPLLQIFAALLLLLNGVIAHLGHSVIQEAMERANFMKRSPMGVEGSASTLQTRSHTRNAITRRAEQADKLRAERGLTNTTPILPRRDTTTYHHSHASAKDISPVDNTIHRFADSSSCILQPEVTAGPYYVSGELVRPSIADGQEVVQLWVDIHLIDTSTCEPMEGVYVEVWHCNATGVYSGVSAEGNGDSDVDTSNLSATFGRGIQQTNEEGMVQFSTVFPGKSAIKQSCL